MNNKIKIIVQKFFKPNFNILDFVWLLLCLIIFRNGFIALLSYMVWLFMSKQLSSNMGFEVVKRWK